LSRIDRAREPRGGGVRWARRARAARAICVRDLSAARRTAGGAGLAIVRRPATDAGDRPCPDGAAASLAAGRALAGAVAQARRRGPAPDRGDRGERDLGPA